MADQISFDNLSFDDFRALAANSALSRHEKVGFPDSYREGKEDAIFADVSGKLRALYGSAKSVIEIGPGCSRLPILLAELCREHNHRLVFVDSAEMLAHLPDSPAIEKQAGRFPDIPGLSQRYAGKADVIIAYSVIQYVHAESNLWKFLDAALPLLADGGEMLLGDIPNRSMRNRFFSGTEGQRMHREFSAATGHAGPVTNALETGRMDDGVVLELLARARAAGFHAWVVPQAADLPMANRREDILIRKP
jgi:hypothetical protein